MGEGLIVRRGGSGNPEGKYVWKKLTAQNGTFIAFVTADAENAYPNGGTQGGYWYEKAEAKVDRGTFTVANNTAWNTKIVVPHNLGKTPENITIAFAPTAHSKPAGTADWRFVYYVNDVVHCYGYSSGQLSANLNVAFSVTADADNIYIENIINSNGFAVAWGLFDYEVRG